MQLNTLDWCIVAASLVLSFWPVLIYARRAGSGVRAARRSTRSCVARSADTVLRRGGARQAVILRFEPGGRLRRHPAGSPQILAVLEGSGEVSGANGVDEPIGAGEAVFLHEGEDHEMKSEAGLMALIIEGEHVDRFRERPKADL